MDSTLHCPRCGVELAWAYHPIVPPSDGLLCFRCERKKQEEQTEQIRQDFARRSGADPDQIVLEDWQLCKPWLEGDSKDNCAYSLLSTRDIPLPDHACIEVLGQATSLYLDRHLVSRTNFFDYGWRYLVEVPGKVDVDFVVERVVPGGDATLFGLLRPIPGEPADHTGHFPLRIDGCIVRTHGGGADQEHKLHSWFDRLFGGSSGPTTITERPDQSTRFPSVAPERRS